MQRLNAIFSFTAPGHDRTAYEITGSQALTYTQIAEQLSRECGRTISYPRPSAKQFKARMKAMGYPDDFVRVVSSIYALARFGMAAGTTGVFEKLTGRSPRPSPDGRRRTPTASARASTRPRDGVLAKQEAGTGKYASQGYSGTLHR